MSDQDPYGDPTRVDTPAADATMAMPAATEGVPTTEPSTPGEPPTEPPGTGEPPSEPPDRGRWILIGLVVAILLVALAWFLLRDDSDDTDTGSGTTTTESSTTTSAPTTTTAAPTTTAPTTTTTAPPTTVDPARCVSSAPDDPEPTAEVVYEAYTLGDRACASNVMTGSALEELFAIPGAGGGWTFMGCQDVEDPEPQTLCSYAFEGGSTTFRMNYSDTDGWTVFEVFQTAD